MDNTVGSLTKLQKSILIGSILGDGYVRILPRSTNAILEINHSFRQKEYVDWKYASLKEICASPPKIRKGNGNRIAYRFYTKQLPEITKLYALFYREKNKIIPDNLKIDEISLAVWYMDDGGRCGSSNYYLNTQQFSPSDQQKLLELLKNFGLEASLNKDKKYSRIRFHISSVPKLKNLIGTILISSMKYKLGYDPVETLRRDVGGVPIFIGTNTSAPRSSIEDEDIVHTMSNH